MNMRYAMYYEDYRICNHCGQKAVTAIDKFLRPTDVLIYPIVKFHCNACNTDFFPKWVKNQAGEMIPVCTGDYVKEETAKSIIKFSEENVRDF